MKKILAIAKWEILQRIKNRLFLATLLITPILVLGVGAASGYLSETGLDYTKVIGIKGAEQNLFSTLQKNFEKDRLKDGQPAFITINISKSENIGSDMIDAIVSLLYRGETYQVSIKPALSISPQESERIKRIVESSIIENVLTNNNENAIVPSIHFLSSQDNDAGLNEFNKLFFTSFAFLFLLIVVVIFSGSNFVRAMLEEKSTHIIEILLSSSSPKNIIVGKYLGLIVIGLIQTVFWFGISYFFFSSGASDLSTAENYPLLVLYFGLGYLLYTSLYLAFGAQVSSEGESQQVTTLISLFLLIPIIVSTQILIAPDSLFSNILTYFPLTTAPIMLIKINITQVSISDILITICSQLLSVAIVFGISAKYLGDGLTQFSRKRRKKI